LYKPIPFIQFFKTKRVIEIADLIVTKIESSEQYYIHKFRYSNYYRIGDIISKKEFEVILSKAKNPIVLSDIYIDLELK